MRYKAIIIISMLYLLSVTLYAVPKKTPQDSIKENIGKILDILNSPDYKEAAKKKELKDQIFSIANYIFSWDEVAKRSLGRKWNAQDADSQKRFVALFSRLLKVNYIDTYF